MAMKFMAHMGDNPRIECEDAKRFSVYVQGTRFWFAVHRTAGSRLPFFHVSHWESGKKLCDVTHSQQAAALGDIVGAAKLALGALIEKHGAARVRSVLAGA